MGTGLGPESYAIIEQGRIGQILSNRPQTVGQWWKKPPESRALKPKNVSRRPSSKAPSRI